MTLTRFGSFKWIEHIELNQYTVGWLLNEQHSDVIPKQMDLMYRFFLVNQTQRIQQV